MDTKPLTAPPAPTDSVRNPLRFEGSAGEYFKIWIVNLALTIITFGIFSAWAKVRSKRYLYGNTYIAGHAFDYHASPWRILLGRVIALALLLGYSTTAAFAPKGVGLWGLLFVVAFPWLIKSSLRFSARNTSYRNLRFDFHGTYWGAVKAFVLWQALAVVTLFIALPFAHRARDYYNINNHSYGPAPFRAKIPVGDLYNIYFLGLGIVICLAIAAMAVGAVVEIIAGAPGAGFMTVVSATTIAVYVLGVLTIPTAIAALTFNLALNNTALGDDIRFEIPPFGDPDDLDRARKSGGDGIFSWIALPLGQNPDGTLSGQLHHRHRTGRYRYLRCTTGSWRERHWRGNRQLLRY